MFGLVIMIAKLATEAGTSSKIEAAEQIGQVKPLSCVVHICSVLGAAKVTAVALQEEKQVVN
jgi:hypothetical protein